MAKRFRRRMHKRKRRFSVKRRSVKKYDSMVKVKMAFKDEMTVTAASGIGEHVVRWGDQANGVTANITRIQNCAEWVRYRDLYQFFQVRGVKI